MAKLAVSQTAGRSASWLVGLAAAGLTSYALYVGVTWLRYGRGSAQRLARSGQLLDQFLPDCEVLERHQIQVHAPSEVALLAARRVDLNSRLLVRALFKSREFLFGGVAATNALPRALEDMVTSIG